MSKKQEELTLLIQPIIEAMGYEFVGMEYLMQGKYSMLRVYIDTPNGVTVDDCGRVSQQIGAVLDVENPIVSHYTLEVSSPGLTRPLFTLEHFNQQIGKMVSVKVSEAIEDQRNFKGIIQSVNNDIITLILDNKKVELPFRLITKANLEPQDVF